jgi:hypothetical protein
MLEAHIPMKTESSSTLTEIRPRHLADGGAGHQADMMSSELSRLPPAQQVGFGILVAGPANRGSYAEPAGAIR